MRCFIICISQLLIAREFRLSPGLSEREPPLETRLASGPPRQRIAQKYTRTAGKREGRSARKMEDKGQRRASARYSFKG